MNKAIVDTTILTDILLNSGESKALAKKALDSFDQTFLPVYAIKEFKSGPLNNFVWMHNKLATVESFSNALEVLQRMSRSPKRYTTSTAIQALKEAAGSISKETLGGLEKKYGADASPDKVMCDEFRLAIKVAILKSWKMRRSVTTDIIQPLSCYREVAPFEKRGMIELEPKGCLKTENCAMAKLLKSRPDEIRAMRDAIISSTKPENQSRARTLRQIYRTPKEPIQNKDCRSLGDAVFVFFASEDTVILTTNTTDHKLLADAVGKKVIGPQDISPTKK